MQDPLESIKAELSQNTIRKPFLFLRLKNGQKAIVRPLYNLDKVLVLTKHYKRAQDGNQAIRAICAHEMGKPCAYCDMARHDKKLTPENYFYLPVYIHHIIDTQTNKPIMYTDIQTQTERPISGLRVLELSRFGAVGAMLKFFNSFYNAPEHGHMLTDYDFSIEHIGTNQQKSYICQPEQHGPMPAAIEQQIPAKGDLLEDILAACPPKILFSET